jgi:hypothetical protein
MFPKITVNYPNKDLKILVIKELFNLVVGIASFFQP